MSIADKFADNNPYALAPVLQCAQTNSADLNVIIRETDALKSTSAFFQQNGLIANPANPVPIVTVVAQQTVGNAISDGSLSPDGEPIPDRGGGFNPIQD